LPTFNDLGASLAQQMVTAFEGEFRLSPGFDPLTAEQIFSLKLDPATQIFTTGDPLTVGQLEQLAAEAGLTGLPLGVQFDFDLQALQEQLGALVDAMGIEGTEARKAFMVGLSTLSTEEITRLRASILDTVNAALESGSPSQLMIRLGTAAGSDLISAFARAANRPIPVLAGMQIGGAVTGSSGGSNSITVNNQINNPVARDILSEVSRLDSLTGAAAASLRAL